MSRARARLRLSAIALIVSAVLATPAFAQTPPAETKVATAGTEAKPAEPAPQAAPAGPARNGREIYQRFREGLADPTCEAGASRNVLRSSSYCDDR